MHVETEEIMSQMDDFIDLARAGIEIIITRDGEPVARLEGIGTPDNSPPQFGTLKGTVLYMAPDFDAPLEDFKEYME